MTAKQKKVFAHLAFWICYVALNHTIHLVQAPSSDVYLVDSISKYLIAAFIFYTTAFFILPAFFSRGRYPLVAISVIAMCFISFTVKEGIYRLLPVLFDYPDSPTDTMQFFLTNFWWWTQYTLWGFAYWYFRQAIEKERMLRQTQQAQLEMENAQLRAQINPHFLFNTLSFFYDQVSDSHPKVADGIVALTDIMRSSIRSPDSTGKVPLDEEVVNIDHLIQIYRYRFNDGIFISFEKQGNFSGLRIIPHVLITLVENALKHGDMHDPEYPITIQLYLTTPSLSFKVANRKRTGLKDLSHGIGIHYLQTQLNFAYSDKSTLVIDEDENFYSTTLRIDTAALAPERIFTTTKS